MKQQFILLMYKLFGWLHLILTLKIEYNKKKQQQRE